jgi:hypothetical protein
MLHSAKKWDDCMNDEPEGAWKEAASVNIKTSR